MGIERVWCTEDRYTCEYCNNSYSNNERIAWRDQGVTRWVCEKCLIDGIREHWAEMEDIMPDPLIGGMILQLYSEHV
jgi:hypothetical protein